MIWPEHGDEPLPAELARGAIRRDNEFAWPVSLFPGILAVAATVGRACLGGQFQRVWEDGSVLELYWLDADASDRMASEPWQVFAERSCLEVAEAFPEQLHRANILTEANAEAKLVENVTSHGGPQLVFCAYFVSEEGWNQLQATLGSADWRAHHAAGLTP